MTGSEDIGARLQRLADLDEIRTLKALYCRWVDSGYESAGDDAGAFANLFADNGVWAVGPEPVVGREAIRARAASLRRFKLHLVANGVIDVDGDRASAAWHGFVPMTTAEGRAVWLAGTYEDTLVRTAGGWRFTSVVFNAAFRTPYDEGWARTPFV